MVSQGDSPGSRVSAALWTVALCGFLAIDQVRDYKSGTYALCEWLIFYPGHFIRRGLRGTVIEWVSANLHVGPMLVVSILCAVAYAALLILAVVGAHRWLWGSAKGWIPLILLSPAGVLFYLNSSGAGNRFDVFSVLLTLAHLELAIRTKSDRAYACQAALLFGTLGVLGALCHEGILFLCLPVNWVLTLRRFGQFDWRMPAIYAAPLVAVVFCIQTRVGPNDLAVLNHTLGLSPELWTPVRFLGLSLPEELRYVEARAGSAAALYTLITVAVFGGVLLVALRRLSEASEIADDSRQVLVKDRAWRDFLLWPFLCSLPLYALGIDYGRWFVAIAVPFTLVLCRTMRLDSLVKPPPLPVRVLAVAIFLLICVPSYIDLDRGRSQLASRFEREAVAGIQRLRHG